MIQTYAAFALNGLDNQERNINFCKNGFPNFETHIACLQYEAFYPRHN